MIPTLLEYLEARQKALRDELSRVCDLIARIRKLTVITTTGTTATAMTRTETLITPAEGK